jgi:hypothetical protein
MNFLKQIRANNCHGVRGKKQAIAVDIRRIIPFPVKPPGVEEGEEELGNLQGQVDLQLQRVGSQRVLVSCRAPEQILCKSLDISVGDPDPNPKDPHVFGPPGSGFIFQWYGSGSGSFPFL